MVRTVPSTVWLTEPRSLARTWASAGSGSVRRMGTRSPRRISSQGRQGTTENPVRVQPAGPSSLHSALGTGLSSGPRSSRRTHPSLPRLGPVRRAGPALHGEEGIGQLHAGAPVTILLDLFEGSKLDVDCGGEPAPSESDITRELDVPIGLAEQYATNPGDDETVFVDPELGGGRVGGARRTDDGDLAAPP